MAAVPLPTAVRASSQPSLRRGLVAAAAALTLLAALFAPPVAATAMYLVPAGGELPAGARVVQALPVADALVVSAPAAPAGGIPVDVPLGWRSLADTADPVIGLRLDSGVASTGAPEAWQTTRGEGALVALVDTGVADVPALAGAVVDELDFTGTGNGDGYGHGTFMASLIAGRGETAPGVAPAVEILSLKVAAADGSTDLGTVLGALQWLHGPGRAAGVTVAALALGVDADTPAGQLLDMATARLAADGVLVVTAAGNEAGALSSPATAPGTFSAGAVDDHATTDRADDDMATFSASGTDRAGVAQPDVVAPGVRIVGTMPCGSAIATEHPQAFVEDGEQHCAAGAAGALFRGSGTSMSTGLAAGVAALAHSANQDLDAPALDTALRAWDASRDPEGLHGPALDAPSAVAAALQLEPTDDRAHPGKGASPAGPPSHAGSPSHVDPAGINWRGINWRGINWRGINWRDTDWQGINWRGINWRGTDWQGINWRGINWRDSDWQGINWRDSDWN